MVGCQTKNPDLIYTFSKDTLLSSIIAMPGQISDFSIINPLENIATKISQPKLYLLTVTAPVVICTVIIFTTIILCSMNNRWYNFIQHSIRKKQTEYANDITKDDNICADDITKDSMDKAENTGD